MASTSVSGQGSWGELPLDVLFNIYQFIPHEERTKAYLLSKQDYARALKLGLGGFGWGENWKAIPGATLQEKINLSRSMRASYRLADTAKLKILVDTFRWAEPNHCPIDRKERLDSSWPLLWEVQPYRRATYVTSSCDKQLFLTFNEEGHPVLESLSERSEQYQEIYERKNLCKIPAIVEERKKIIKAFHGRPCEEETIWQDLRNRAFFFRQLENERIHLLLALSVNKKTRNEIPLWRMALSKISSLFTLTPDRAAIKNPKKLLMSEEWDLVTPDECFGYTPDVAETSLKYYTFSREPRKVTIRIGVPTGRQHLHSGAVTLFVTFFGGARLEGLRIRRVWISADDSKHYSEEATIQPGQQVRLRPDSYLSCSTWSHSRCQQDEVGNLPVATLLVRLAVEIFAREGDQRLIYETTNPNVLAAMGFREMPTRIGRRKEIYQKALAPMNHALQERGLKLLNISEEQEPIDAQLRKGLNELRNERGRKATMFPTQEKGAPRIAFQLVKYKEKAGDQETKFGVLDEFFRPQPTEFLGLTFKRRRDKMRYEDFFREEGFLLPGDPNRPILPKFLKQDLSKYIVYPSKSTKPPLLIKGRPIINPELYYYDTPYLRLEEYQGPYQPGFLTEYLPP